MEYYLGFKYATAKIDEADYHTLRELLSWGTAIASADRMLRIRYLLFMVS